MSFPFSSLDFVFLGYLFLRISGFFFSLPLFSHPHIPRVTKTFFLLFLVGLIGMLLYPDYRGEKPLYVLKELHSPDSYFLLRVLLTSIKEVLTGYLIGFCFSLLLDIARFGGELCSSAMGLSAAQMIDPISSLSQPLLSHFFTLSLSLLLFAFDFHHLFFSAIKESFSIIPLGHYELSQEMINALIKGGSRVYLYGIRLIIIPYIILFLITIMLGIMAKAVPQMNVFIVGFPVKIFVGFYALILSVKFLPTIAKNAFIEYSHLVEELLYFLLAKQN